MASCFAISTPMNHSSVWWKNFARDQGCCPHELSATSPPDVVRETKLLLLGAIDNLIKGASGAAVQNFNLMYDFARDRTRCCK